MASKEFLNQQRAWHLRESHGTWRGGISKNPLGQTVTTSDWKTNRRMMRTSVQTRTISPYQEHYATPSIIHHPLPLEIRGKYATFPKWTVSPVLGTANFPS